MQGPQEVGFGFGVCHDVCISDQELWEASVGFKTERGLLCFRLIMGHWGLWVRMDCNQGKGQWEKQGGWLEG